MSLFHKIYFLTTFAHTWMKTYRYAWRLKCLGSWMLGHSHALMIMLKSKGDWTVRCMCTWMLKYSCACMFNALLITCSHVFLLQWLFAYMSTCLDGHMFLCSCVLTFTCFYIHMFWWSYTFMFTCFYDGILLCLYALTTNVHLPKCPNAHILGDLYDWILTC